jgi:hypothetical protein
MRAMGPEAAVLNASLGSRRVWRAYANLEYSRENPLYVAVALHARAERFPALLGFDRPLGPWSRLRKALRLGADRRLGRSPYVPGVGGAERRTALSVCAVPTAWLFADEGRQGVGGKAANLATLPLHPETLG